MCVCLFVGLIECACVCVCVSFFGLNVCVRITLCAIILHLLCVCVCVCVAVASLSLSLSAALPLPPEATELTVLPEDTMAKVGEEVLLDCGASYDPMLDITFVWAIDHRIIDFQAEWQHYERVVVLMLRMRMRMRRRMRRRM